MRSRKSLATTLRERTNKYSHVDYRSTGRRVSHRPSSISNFKPWPPCPIHTGNGDRTKLYIRRTLFSFWQTLLLILLSLWSNDILCKCKATASALSTDELTSDSVVLITGASTPIASHLALTLCNTYQARLLLVDSLSLHTYQSHLEKDDVSIPLKVRHQFQEDQREPSKVSNDLNQHETQSWASNLEHDRQRLPHVLSTCGTLAKFYRVDFRTVPLQYAHEGESHVNFLQTLLQEEDITHVVHFEQAGVVGSARARRDRAVFKSHHLDIKLDTMESILHELLALKGKNKSQTNDVPVVPVVPHLTYASSSQVYAPQIISTPAAPSDTTRTRTRTTINKAREDENIQVPKLSTLGTRHLMQEVLARKYAERYGIYSIGLRFFNVYGEWSSPHDTLFQFAERAVLKKNGPVLASPVSMEEEYPMKRKQEEENGLWCWWKQERDYIHVEDAVDALLAAMQFRSPPLFPPGHSEDKEPIISSLVINVGAGKGTTLTDIATIMEDIIPPNNGILETTHETQSIVAGLEAESTNFNQIITSRVASTERARILLGFEPKITLKEGLLRLVAWHNDRAFPYQPNPNIQSEESRNDVLKQAQPPETIRTNLDQVGISACSPLQRDCHSSLVVVPCISECSHFKSCLPSLYDDVALITRYLTHDCDSARYTVVWDWGVTSLPSIIESNDISGRNSKYCNLAFIPEESKLYQFSKKQQKPNNKIANDANELFRLIKNHVNDESNRAIILKEMENLLLFHGEWTLIPLSVPDKDNLSRLNNWNLLKDLPKYSPGRFFAPTVTYAFYREFDVPFPATSIAMLVDLMHLPPTPNMQKDFSTVLLLTRSNNAADRYVTNNYADSCNASLLEETKNRWYNAIRIALGKHMTESSSTGFEASSPWIGHDLVSADGHELRCDIYSELWRWKENVKYENEKRCEKDASLGFITALHNFWSSMMEIERGSGVWWESNYRSTPEKDLRGHSGKSEAWENYAILSNSERVQSFVRIAPSDILDFHKD